MKEDNYLSDEEIMNLINDVEREGLMAAPEDVTKNVLSAIGSERKSAKPQKQIYYNYCLKVGLSIAASIAIMVGVTVQGLGSYDVPARNEVEKQVESKEEVLSASKADIATKLGIKDILSDIEQYL